MQMFNVLEYSQNYSMKSENLSNYYRYEIKDVDNNASSGKPDPDIDLSRQTNTNIPQQFSFIEELEEYDGATMLFICEKQQKPIFNFSLDSLVGTEYYKKWNIKEILNLLNGANNSKFLTRK